MPGNCISCYFCQIQVIYNHKIAPQARIAYGAIFIQSYALFVLLEYYGIGISATNWNQPFS